ncbi:hypothetical protein FB107DRAFT_276733 [Schizophyllum commune]
MQNVNATRDLRNARAVIEQYKHILEYAGLHAVPGLHRIFALALQGKWSTAKLLKHLTAAVEGTYHPCNYSKMDIHLGVLIYVFGGASALRACQKSYLALPSLSTVQCYRRQFNITISTDAVKLLEIIDNINIVHGPRDAVDPADESDNSIPEKCGHTLGQDEVNIEEKVEYVPEKDHIGGCCLEHVGCLGSVCVGEGTRTVEIAADAMRDGKVHAACEATVATISRLSRTGYGARPVYIGPTCKRRTWQESVSATLHIVEAWRRAENGEKKHGPIFNIASDGDAIRRASMFVICMSEEIVQGHPLWENLHELFPLGLNPRIGKGNLSMDFDYKHLIKRLCTQLCSPQGMLVNNESVNKNIILLFLERIPNRRWSETSVLSLLEPDDAQDVPRARGCTRATA